MRGEGDENYIKIFSRKESRKNFSNKILHQHENLLEGQLKAGKMLKKNTVWENMQDLKTKEA